MSDGQPITNIRPLIAPKSDQLNADDLLTTSITVQILAVVHGTTEQPTEIPISGHKPWRPCKTMCRLLAAAWEEEDPQRWIGRWVRLYRDPKVRFGNAAEGGIRVSHISGILEPKTLSLTETRGKRRPWRVEPLSFADILAAMGISAADLDAYCEATGKPIPSAGDEGYRAKVIAAFSRPNGRAGFDAWKAGR